MNAREIYDILVASGWTFEAYRSSRGEILCYTAIHSNGSVLTSNSANLDTSLREFYNAIVGFHAV